MPGYQFSSGNYQVNSGGFVANGSAKNNFAGSLDFGWYFTNHVGLHVGYVYDDGDYHYNFHYGPYYFGDFSLKRQINIAEIGPEFLFGNKVDQVYIQLNAGYTFGGGTTYYYYGGSRYNLGNLGDNTFIYGAAVGYRHYFNDTVALAIQGGLSPRQQLGNQRHVGRADRLGFPVPQAGTTASAASAATPAASAATPATASAPTASASAAAHDRDQPRRVGAPLHSEQVGHSEGR